MLYMYRNPILLNVILTIHTDITLKIIASSNMSIVSSTMRIKIFILVVFAINYFIIIDNIKVIILCNRDFDVVVDVLDLFEK